MKKLLFMIMFLLVISCGTGALKNFLVLKTKHGSFKCIPEHPNSQFDKYTTCVIKINNDKLKCTVEVNRKRLNIEKDCVLLIENENNF